MNWLDNVAARFRQFDSAQLVLGGFLLAGAAIGVLYQTGILGAVIRLVARIVRTSVWSGFVAWKYLLAWLPWPLLLVVVLALHFGALAAGARRRSPAVWPCCSLA